MAVILLVVLALCIYVIHWWQISRIKEEYQKKAHELESLYPIIEEKHQQDHLITNLEEERQALAQIIHRDNKLIPAMEYTVRNFIKSNEEAPNADQLLEQLEEMSKERIGIIKTRHTGNKMIQTTNIDSIDILLFYMYNKAKEYDVAFDVMVSNDITDVCSKEENSEGLLCEADLRTLLADLIDNAINATRAVENGRILIDFRNYEYFRVDIYDNGVPFDKEVLAVMGQRQITTHAGDGGSGIGLMSSTAILNKRSGRLIVEEFAADNGLYTKVVSACFG
ncbi:MAG: GHKL domain-containing protein [Christensenellaceae bacterium]|nr:GHKL domain-containing protein [Christensenellaceae bacterium]